MPTGQKVGDAYIEVTPELDTSKIDAQVQRLAEKLERKLGGAGNKAGHQFATNFNRQVNAAVKSTGLKFDKMFGSIEGAQARHHQKMLDGQRALLRAQNQQMAAQYERQLKMRKNHVDQANRIKMPLSPVPVPAGAPTPSAPRGSGGGGRTGRPERSRLAGAYSDVISILPGQLEGLFKDPKVAAVVVAGATALGGIVAPALVGAMGIAGGLAGVAMATSFLAKADPAFKKATETIGANLQQALLAKLAPVAPVLQGLLQAGGTAIKSIIQDIDLGPIQRMAEMIGGAFQEWSPIISDIVNSIFRIAENAMPTFLSIVGRVLEGFDKILFTAEQNKDTINSILNIIGDVAVAALAIVDGFIQLGGAMNRAYDTLVKFNPLLRVMSEIMPTPLRDIGQTTGDVDIAATSVEDLSAKLKALGSNGESAFAQQGQAALTAAGGLLANANASENAAKAQQDLNRAIDEYNSKVVDQNISAAEVSNSLKDLSEQMKKNHGVVKLGTRAGNDNIISLGRQLDSYYRIAKGIRDAGGTAEQANAKFNALTNQLKNNKGMTDAARKAVEEMARKYRDFNGLPNIRKTVTVTPPNLTAVKAALDSLKGDINVRVNTHTGEIISPSKLRRNIEKQTGDTAVRANGGIVRGPGTETSDSIPAMLSDKEYVIRAAAVKKLGTGFLDQVNAGKVPIARASGGMAGRSKTTAYSRFKNGGQARAASKSTSRVSKSQVARLINLNKQMAVLTKVIEKQTVIDERYQQKIDSMRDMFNQYVNLSQIDLEGKKTGNVISELITRAKDSSAFGGRVKELQKRGLSAEGVNQVLAAGPSSPLAKMLMDASAADIKAINKALNDQAFADQLTKDLNPMSAANRELIASNKALQKAIEKQIFILEDKGVAKRLPEQKHAGGKTTFTPAQLKQIRDSLKLIGKPLNAGGGIRVEVGGTEVNTVIRKVNAKDSRPHKRATKTRKRR